LFQGSAIDRALRQETQQLRGAGEVLVFHQIDGPVVVEEHSCLFVGDVAVEGNPPVGDQARHLCNGGRRAARVGDSDVTQDEERVAVLLEAVHRLDANEVHGNAETSGHCGEEVRVRETVTLAGEEGLLRGQREPGAIPEIESRGIVEKSSQSFDALDLGAVEPDFVERGLLHGVGRLERIGEGEADLGALLANARDSRVAVGPPPRTGSRRHGKNEENAKCRSPALHETRGLLSRQYLTWPRSHAGSNCPGTVT